MTSIGERIHARMAEIDMSEQAVADALGISQQAVNYWKTMPDRRPRDIVAVATLLGVSPGWLRTGSGPKFPDIAAIDPKTLRKIVITSVADLKDAGLEPTPERVADQFVINLRKYQNT